MKFNMNTVKKNISNFFEKVKILFSTHKKIAIIVLSALFLIALIIFIVMFSVNNNSLKKQKSAPTIERNDTEIGVGNKTIDPGALWLLDEPLQLPPIQFSREQRQIWKQDEVDYWYEVPDEEAMNELRSKNDKLIQDILEDAP